ncbi:hypothetical protein MLIT_40930 [Mycolicibacterium litorale]|uniref:Uncharacterized protein n=1 Tax=Mycolicibacterium litorale TaxID=758802 RepID=A0AAD1IP45_9MYCO|nr:hypothetical protein BCL50_3852 [Mycolicibacterium litorale]BBY18501.1 hypothetical protein MLIT_40930 [Mycolicibacterium litorale]
MSLTTALIELKSANDALRSAIAELVMTVHEDRPVNSDIAAMDALLEVVLELQATAAAAGERLDAAVDARDLPVVLVDVQQAVAECALRYWRDLRSYGPMSRMRSTARARGYEWRTWQNSVEQSQLRCEPPLQRSVETVHTAWREIGELLRLYLPTSEQPAQASASAIAADIRRP